VVYSDERGRELINLLAISAMTEVCSELADARANARDDFALNFSRLRSLERDVDSISLELVYLLAAVGENAATSAGLSAQLHVHMLASSISPWNTGEQSDEIGRRVGNLIAIASDLASHTGSTPDEVREFGRQLRQLKEFTNGPFENAVWLVALGSAYILRGVAWAAGRDPVAMLARLGGLHDASSRVRYGDISVFLATSMALASVRYSVANRDKRAALLDEYCLIPARMDAGSLVAGDQLASAPLILLGSLVHAWCRKAGVDSLASMEVLERQIVLESTVATPTAVSAITLAVEAVNYARTPSGPDRDSVKARMLSLLASGPSTRGSGMLRTSHEAAQFLALVLRRAAKQAGGDAIATLETLENNAVLKPGVTLPGTTNPDDV